MDPLQQGHGALEYDMPQLMNPPPQIFGAYNADGSPIPPTLDGQIFGDLGDPNYDDINDPKRRRIARVRNQDIAQVNSRLTFIGVRHVSQEENQV